jgi:Leucine-rich repeat (LRR) protein
VTLNPLVRKLPQAKNFDKNYTMVYKTSNKSAKVEYAGSAAASCRYGPLITEDRSTFAFKDTFDVLKDQCKNGHSKKNKLEGLHLNAQMEDDPEATRYILQEEIQKFLVSEQPVCFLFGQAGSGKTTFGKALQSEHGSAPEKNDIVVLYVSLDGHTKKSAKQSIENTLIDQGLNREKIDLLKKSAYHFVFIFDGYDRLQGHGYLNLYEANGLKSWGKKSQVIITCRTGHLNHNTCSEHSSSDTTQYQEPTILYIAPLRHDQVRMGLTELAKNKKLAESQEIYTRLLQFVPESAKLISTPFLLYACFTVYFELTSKLAHGAIARLDRNSFYEALINLWFKNEEDKLLSKKATTPEHVSTRTDVEPDESLTENCLDFSRALAFAMYKKEIKEVKPTNQPSSLHSENKIWEGFFSRKVKKKQLHHRCPLRLRGDATYSFIHESLMEYFIADYLWQALLNISQTQQESIGKAIEIWGTRHLNEESEMLSVIEFLTQKLKSGHENGILKLRLLSDLLNANYDKQVEHLSHTLLVIAIKNVRIVLNSCNCLVVPIDQRISHARSLGVQSACRTGSTELTFAKNSLKREDYLDSLRDTKSIPCVQGTLVVSSFDEFMTLSNAHEIVELDLSGQDIGKKCSKQLGDFWKRLKLCRLIETLDLDGNDLTLLPESFGELPLLKLKRLSFENNKLTGIPRSFGKLKLPALEHLTFRQNQLRELPDTFVDLHFPALSTLDFCGNKLTLLDKLFGKTPLPNLERLNLAQNRLSNISTLMLLDLPSLIVLNLSRNDLFELPNDFGQLKLPKLEELNLTTNRLQTLPLSFGKLNLPNLRELLLGFNCLTTLPELHGLGSSALELLDLSGNKLTILTEWVKRLPQGIVNLLGNPVKSQTGVTSVPVKNRMRC